MGDFRANEIFSGGAFVMLRIDAGWSEKFVRLSLDPIAELARRWPAGADWESAWGLMKLQLEQKATHDSGHLVLGGGKPGGELSEGNRDLPWIQ